MKELFGQFLKEKTFLANVSQKTIRFYDQSFRAFTRHGGRLDKSGLSEFVVNMRSSGLSAVSCNVYIRGINSFLTWLHENGHITERLRIKQLKCEKKVMPTFTDVQLKALATFKPVSWVEKRIHTICLVLMDTGCRIEEILTLERTKVDFDNLLLTVRGKGNKERTIPMSLELRKVLYKHLKTHKHDLVFCTRDGGKLGYHNVRRDFQAMAKNVGIEGKRTSFHTLRHTFAKQYLKHGGNVFYLNKILGHESLEVTRRYVDVETEALQAVHAKTSILARLR